MLDQVNATPTPHKRLPWNKGKLTGAKPPLRRTSEFEVAAPPLTTLRRYAGGNTAGTQPFRGRAQHFKRAGQRDLHWHSCWPY
jgi:hypothetical protein